MASKEHILNNKIKNEKNARLAEMEAQVLKITWPMLHKPYSNEPSEFGIRLAQRMGMEFSDLEEYYMPIIRKRRREK